MAPHALRIRAVPGTAESAPEAVADLEALAAALGDRGPDALLLAGAPPVLARHVVAGGSTTIARAGAATERVPAAWARALESVDAVWVPGEHAREALAASGVARERLHVVGPVVDVERFAPDGPAARAQDARGFVFLAPLDWTRARGWDLVLRAYVEEFDAEEDVSLVIRAWSSLGYSPQLVAEALHGELDALGHDPVRIADVIVEVADDHAALSPAAYRGADCVVAPTRGEEWGRTLLEAMACGVPLIATDWGTGADLLPADGALRVPATVSDVSVRAARELPALAGQRWAEPDVGELRALMRAVHDDPDAAAAIAARGRAHVAAHHAIGRGIDAPTNVAPRGRVPRPEPAAGGPGARPQDVSFVLQGPVDRAGRGRTAAVCASIRAHFPGAEIVVSTWAGTDASGLDCDVVVHSEDPGVVGPCTYNVNTNRQIVSSLAGVRAASRPLVMKTRSDILFVSDSVLSHWGRWEERCEELRLFDRRVLMPNVFARRPSYLNPYPLHPSDWCYLGTRADIERLFDVPHMTRKKSVTHAKRTPLTRLYHPLEPRPTYTPEQWIWTQALRKVAPRAALAHAFDLTPGSLRLTELSFANNLAILDTYTQFGIWCPKYAGPNRVIEDITLVQHEDWLELYELHCRGASLPRAAVADVLAAIATAGDDEDGAELDATLADAADLRRAGLAWEAQLLECVLHGSRVRRDSTTGGAHRWHLDRPAVELARAELVRCARLAVRRDRAAA